MEALRRRCVLVIGDDTGLSIGCKKAENEGIHVKVSKDLSLPLTKRIMTHESKRYAHKFKNSIM
jgi:hypothetical protein